MLPIFQRVNTFLQTSRGKKWIKIVLVLIFGGLLYYSITREGNLPMTREAFLNNLSLNNLPFLLVAGLLMPLNWWIECLKWQKVLKPIHRFEIFDSLRSVLIGVSSSIFTPNRIGEFIGRVIILPGSQRWQGAAALLLVSFAQLDILCILGSISMLFINHSLQLFKVDSIISLAVASIILTVFLAFIIYTPQLYARISWNTKRTWQLRIERTLSFITKLTHRVWICICTLTFIRILVYVTQYFLLLRFYGIEVSWDLATTAILVTYFLQSSVPLPPLVSLLARGEIALIVWELYEVNELSVLAASYSLWVINVLIPALVGMVFVVRIKQLNTVNDAVG